MSWGVNLLKSGPKISNPTKRYATQLTLFDINGILALNVAPSKLDQCFGHLKRLIAKACFETGVLGQSSNYILRNQ